MTTTALNGETLPADTTTCDCATCAAVRDGITAMRSDLPRSLKHDDGTPNMVSVAGQDITVLEARLRLALQDLDPSDTATATKVRAAVAALREDGPLSRFHFNRAAALLENLR